MKLSVWTTERLADNRNAELILIKSSHEITDKQCNRKKMVHTCQ